MNVGNVVFRRSVSPTMKMDGNNSDHSRTVSENTNGSWSWDTEDVSISRLHLVPTCDDLQDLVEDKEIAACAVAFVVNSTRKGIVPLCADVASLMRAKRRLEKRVVRLKREVEVLRNSAHRGSHSSTPTSLQSYMSDRGSFMDPAHVQVFNELLKGTQCHSTTSQSSSSSQVGCSPKFERRCRSGGNHTSALVSQPHLEPGGTNSFGDDAPSDVALCMVAATENQILRDINNSEASSCPQHDVREDDCRRCDHDEDTCTASLTSPCDRPDLTACRCDRSHHKCHCSSDTASESCGIDPVSLQSSHGQPDDCQYTHRKSGSMVRNRPGSAGEVEQLRSMEDCCCRSDSMLALEEQFNKSLEINMKLANELATTRRQMQELTIKLRQFELRELEYHGGSRSVPVAGDAVYRDGVMSPIGSRISSSSSERVSSYFPDSPATSVSHTCDSNSSGDGISEVSGSAKSAGGNHSVNKQANSGAGRDKTHSLRPLHRTKAFIK